jgi:2-keto-4-pentenoate hydratase/2-oxohepta-3-ene-1,7-dioic acid hydratase in catechol pathway
MPTRNGRGHLPSPCPSSPAVVSRLPVHDAAGIRRAPADDGQVPGVVGLGLGGDAIAPVVPPAVAEGGEHADAGAAGDAVGLGVVAEGVAVPRTSKVICIGLNYESHARETGQGIPGTPAVFSRWPATLNVDGGTVTVPRGEPGLDWEAELAVIVGSAAHQIPPAEADAAILGYSAFNDLTARHRQFASSQWTLGKNVPGSGPLGPVIVTKDEIADPGDLAVTARVNGAVMQQARTSELIFGIHDLLAYLSDTIALEPGDIIATGTPAGIGFARDPAVLLGANDIVEVEIEKIGVLRTTIIASTAPASTAPTEAGPAEAGTVAAATTGGVRGA